MVVKAVMGGGMVFFHPMYIYCFYNVLIINDLPKFNSLLGAS